MKKPHREHDRLIRPLIFGLSLLLAIPCSVTLAQTITSSGLNTAVSAPNTLPSGQTQFDITGGTRPGGGPNLFHSFGEFGVPANNIANFLNETTLPTSNILGRVTGGNISNIFGTIHTTGFGNANLFLMNPTGFLFGPNATVNVGGMVSFTSADYLKLADGARFNAIPHALADTLLSTAPVAAFGFLGSNPGAITVQGSQLSVAEGTGISLVGGNMTVQAGTLTAPSGAITLVSVGKPSHANVGGEVVVAGSAPGTGYTPTGFRSMGTINLSEGSTVDVSSTFSSQQPAGGVVIRAGQFVMDNSSIEAATTQPFTSLSGGNVEVAADQIALSNGSRIDTIHHGDGASSGNITFNANTFSATDSAIDASGGFLSVAGGGAVTIQGLQGSGTYAHAVSLRNTEVFTTSTLLVGGPITIRGENISLNHTTLSSSPGSGTLAGSITLVSRSGLNIQDSQFSANADFGQGGTVDLRAGTSLNLTSTTINASGERGGSVTMAAPIISLRGSTVDVTGGFHGGFAGTISLTGNKAVSLTNGTVLSADGISSNGGTVLINGGARFTSQQSTISAQALPIGCVPACVSNGNGGTIHIDANKVQLTDTQITTSVSGGPQSVGGSITVEANKATLRNSQILSTATEGHGGTIHIDANKVQLTDTQITTSVSGGPQTVGGNITIDGNKVTLDNSQVLSTATEGHGGTIGITTHKLHSTNSVIDATSQSGTDGTVTIQRP